MTALAPRYCERCGHDLESLGADHRCVGSAELEPPRYCGQCKRRMVVQITPAGWSARCSEHGTSTSSG